MSVGQYGKIVVKKSSIEEKYRKGLEHFFSTFDVCEADDYLVCLYELNEDGYIDTLKKLKSSSLKEKTDFCYIWETDDVPWLVYCGCSYRHVFDKTPVVKCYTNISYVDRLKLSVLQVYPAASCCCCKHWERDETANEETIYTSDVNDLAEYVICRVMGYDEEKCRKEFPYLWQAIYLSGHIVLEPDLVVEELKRVEKYALYNKHKEELLVGEALSFIDEKRSLFGDCAEYHAKLQFDGHDCGFI